MKGREDGKTEDGVQTLETAEEMFVSIPFNYVKNCAFAIQRDVM